jgi:hypothetical protein
VPCRTSLVGAGAAVGSKRPSSLATAAEVSYLVPPPMKRSKRGISPWLLRVWSQGLWQQAALPDHTFTELLEKLRHRALPVQEIGPAMVRLAKPFDPDRIHAAREVVASYLDHPDDWVRHEAMWFLTSWGRMSEYRPQLLQALRHDPDLDNRSYAALCLEHLYRGERNAEVEASLAAVVLDEVADLEVRLSAYGALLEIVKQESGWDFRTDERDLAEVDWAWVRGFAAKTS